jgi:NADH-quinone oxidoreductase subunit G
MAAAAQTELVNILVNDIELQVPKGEIIVESVKRLGLEIPIFCYHARMKPVGMCRMCLVEVGFKGPDGTIKKMPKPQAACTLPASEGMAIYTDTEMVHRDRKGVLEFLLVNHPLDCPICDRGGECPLQNNTLFYGPSTSRFVELKRHLPKAFPLSDYVTLDLERCIQCGRCVRFTEEISGDAELAFRFRGAEMQPSTFELRKFTSKFSGNVIEICPVGALTNAKYRFRARPWDLETRPAICTMCSNGCNIWFDYRVNKVVRINGRTNEAVNEEWTCDKGKFGHYWYNSDKRLSTPLIRKGDALVPCTWADAYAAIIEAFGAGGNQVAALAGDQLSNEDLFCLQRLFRREFRSNNLDHRFTKHLQSLDQRLENVMGIPQVQTKIEEFESKKKILVFGTSLADDEPILFLRVRKAWFQNGAQVVVAHHEATEVDDFATAVLRYKPGTEIAVASGILNYMVRTGKAQVPPETRDALAKFTPHFVEQTSGVPAAQLDAVAAGLDGAVIITTESILDVHQAQNTIEMLGGLAMTTGGEFNLYGLLSNSEGAARLGILPDSLPGLCKLSDDPGAPAEKGLGTDGILRGCDEGTVKALWLADAHPLARHSDSDLALRALENVDFLVYQGILETEEMAYASVVLPMCPPAECDGSFTNMEGRVQRMNQVLPSLGESRPAWKVFSEVGVRIRPETPLFSPREVMDVIARTVPGWEVGRYEDLPLEGAILGLGKAAVKA